MTAFWRFIEALAAGAAEGGETPLRHQVLAVRVAALKAADLSPYEAYLADTVLTDFDDSVLPSWLMQYVDDVTDFLLNDVGVEA